MSPGAGLSRGRLPFLALGMIALLSGLWGGLARLGWTVPATWPGAASLHGPLMVSGFVGTVIGLERAAGLGWRWTYAAPLATALGATTIVLETSSRCSSSSPTPYPAWSQDDARNAAPHAEHG